MKCLAFGAALLVLAAAGPLSAQTVGGQGFAVVGPGTVSDGGGTTLHMAGGGEALVKRLGLGALFEVGFLGPSDYLSEGIGVLSINGVYHIRVSGPERGAGVSPFVTGGYSLFFREGHLNMWNVGGGVDWWFRSKVGLRIELRDQLRHESFEYAPSSSYSHTWHFWNVRTGVVFR